MASPVINVTILANTLETGGGAGESGFVVTSSQSSEQDVSDEWNQNGDRSNKSSG